MVDAPDSPVLQEVALGTQWPTVDPFLFCAHHLDRYPEGDGQLGPAASLAGRDLGQDFAGKDGWNMYHGSHVPGFPQHPHRGFETVTIVREGLCDHSDSLGAAARFGRGDAQWITAGGGIVHSEMFPLLRTDAPNPLHLFQIWLNLPAADKLVPAHFTMLWSEDIPKVTALDADGGATTVTVYAGELEGATALAPPPDSWASHPEADIAIWLIELEAGARFTLPPAHGAETIRTLYAYEGAGIEVGGHPVANDRGAVVACDRPVELVAGPEPVELLVLQGRPLAEPVARYGPYVMTTETQLREAFADYQRTGFGGWPWDDDAPHHGPDRGRFALHADGRLEER